MHYIDAEPGVQKQGGCCEIEVSPFGWLRANVVLSIGGSEVREELLVVA